MRAVYQGADRYLDIRQGDALLFHGTLPHSKLIERVSDSEYSHAAIVTGTLGAGALTPGRVMVAESLEGKGVRSYNLDRYLRECAREGCRVDWFQMDQTAWDPQDRCKAICFALDQVGDDYVSLFQLMWSFLRINKLIRKVLPFLKVDLDKKRWFCSELVAGAYHVGGLEIPKIPALLAPQQIAELPYLSFAGTLLADEAADLAA